MAASNTRFTQNSLGQSKTPIDSDHGIYRYSAARSSRCSAARRRGRSRRALGRGRRYPLAGLVLRDYSCPEVPKNFRASNSSNYQFKAEAPF
jgi:hypothetical protein